MHAREITEKKVWQDLLEAAKPDSFLHSWEWGMFEAGIGHPATYLGVFDGEKLVAVSLWSKVAARRGTFLLSPHGPIVAASAQEKLEEVLGAINAAIIPIAKRERCDLLRVSTLISDTSPHRAAFAAVGFRNAPIHVHSETAWILDVSPSEEQLLAAMKKNTRYSIRKAEKDGVTVSKSDKESDFDTFWDIYQATASRQKFASYSYEFLKREFMLFARDGKAVLFTGSYRDTPVSTAMVIYDNGSGVYHHGGSNQKFPSITASEAVQWAAIREAKTRGCNRYNFWGIVPESDPKHPWYGLTKFKQGFGGYLQQYVPTQDMPLTRKYWLTYAVEKVRKMRRRL